MRFKWILTIAIMLCVAVFMIPNNDNNQDRLMYFDDTYEVSVYEQFPKVYKDIAYESFPQSYNEVEVYYETFKVIYKNDFNQDHKLVSVKKPVKPLTVFRVIRLITLGIN